MLLNICINPTGCPKKVGLRILNRFDSYCLKEHLDGSKLGKKWIAFNMAWQYLILMEEPLKYLEGR